MGNFFGLVGILLILYLLLTREPKLDYTVDKKLLLWYNGNNERKYIKIW